MAGIRERIAALERYRRCLDTSSGVAVIVLEESGGWEAKYGGMGGTFPTEAQARHYIHQHAPQSAPVIVIDV